MDEKLYSVEQVSILLKVHQLTVRRYIRMGKLKAIKIAGNIRIPASYLDELSQDVRPTEYGIKVVPKKTRVEVFTPDDAIFRLKGRGLSIRAI